MRTTIQKPQAVERFDPEAHNAQGVQRALSGRLAEAVACFRVAVMLKPDFAEGRNNLALVLKEQGGQRQSAGAQTPAARLTTQRPPKGGGWTRAR